MSKIRETGFSIVELLITLTILGVIATFTIPALFQVPANKQTSKYTTMARDTAFMVAAAYDQYRAANASVTSGVQFNNLTPYMHYLRTDTTTVIDAQQTATTWSCAAYSCLRLSNGAILLYSPTYTLGGTSTTNTTYFVFDPDGIQTDGTTNGPGKSLVVFLQYDGTMHTWGTLPATVSTSAASYSVTPNNDPPWFTGF